MRQWLDLVVRRLYSFGSLLHGCLFLLMLYLKKVTYTVKVSVSWALLPLLTDHSFSYRRHKIWATGSNGGRWTKVAAARPTITYQRRLAHMTQCSPLFPWLYERILHDVFIEKAGGWDHAPSSRIVSLLLPTHGCIQSEPTDTCGLCKWLQTLLEISSPLTSSLRRERRRPQARHIWEKIQPNWPMIEERVKHATGLPHERYRSASFFTIIQKVSLA